MSFHFRGHGVHSPFVYSLVREVFLFCERRSFGVNCVHTDARTRRRMASLHRSTSIERRGYLLLFDDGLPKQHFRL